MAPHQLLEECTDSFFPLKLDFMRQEAFYPRIVTGGFICGWQFAIAMRGYLFSIAEPYIALGSFYCTFTNICSIHVYDISPLTSFPSHAYTATYVASLLPHSYIKFLHRFIYTSCWWCERCMVTIINSCGGVATIIIDDSHVCLSIDKSDCWVCCEKFNREILLRLYDIIIQYFNIGAMCLHALADSKVQGSAISPQREEIYTFCIINSNTLLILHMCIYLQQCDL